MTSAPASSTSQPELQAAEEEIEEELCRHDLEEADSLLELVQDLVTQHLDDFPDDGIDDNASRYASKMAKANITDGTRTGHLRILKHYFIFHLRRNKDWDANRVDEQTPRDIAAFITQKCGPFPLVLRSQCGIGAFGLMKVRRKWRLNPATNTWHGLPTRSRHVSQFMVGLEKTKAKSGEVSSSARALSLDDIHRLYDHCLNPSLSLAEKRAGIVRYVAYLLAWLMMLRVDEVIHLTFENIDKIPGELLTDP
ncbi:hypothetical protein B0H14DRAFT_3134723 [Mycena olivaceomarginata]|nr:hypothetical protein B0H14DRAFT_3134723 [Mycena olivaceomarginata]